MKIFRPRTSSEPVKPALTWETFLDDPNEDEILRFLETADVSPEILTADAAMIKVRTIRFFSVGIYRNNYEANENKIYRVISWIALLILISHNKCKP